MVHWLDEASLLHLFDRGEGREILARDPHEGKATAACFVSKPGRRHPAARERDGRGLGEADGIGQADGLGHVAKGLSTPGALPGSHDIELLANASSSLAAAISRLALLCEFQFVEKADRQKEFEEWSEHRLLEEEVAALRAAQKR